MIKTTISIDLAGQFMSGSSPQFSNTAIGNDIYENPEFSNCQKRAWSLSLQDIVGRLK